MRLLQDRVSTKKKFQGAHRALNGRRFFDIAQITHDMKKVIQVGLANAPHDMKMGATT